MKEKGRQNKARGAASEAEGKRGEYDLQRILGDGCSHREEKHRSKAKSSGRKGERPSVTRNDK